MGRIIQLADGSLETISSYRDILNVIEAKLGREIAWEIEEYNEAGQEEIDDARADMERAQEELNEAHEEIETLKDELAQARLRIKTLEDQLMAKQTEPRPPEPQPEPLKPQLLETVTPTAPTAIPANIHVTFEVGPKLLDAFTSFILAARELGERAQATAKEAYEAAKPANEYTPPMPAVAAQPSTLADTTTAASMTVKVGPALTLDSVMREAKDKADAGFHEQIINLVAKYGVKNISKIPPDKLGAFIAEVRALGAA